MKKYLCKICQQEPIDQDSFITGKNDICPWCDRELKEKVISDEKPRGFGRDSGRTHSISSN